MAQAQWHFSFSDGHITLEGVGMLHMDNICRTLTEFTSRYALTVREVMTGADRLQLSFTWQGQGFLLCFEGLCDVIWIECLYVDNIKQLADLYSYLLTKQDNN